ncbi:MAG: GGDEF domain-containing response regulator [Nitrospirota bacterium]
MPRKKQTILLLEGNKEDISFFRKLFDGALSNHFHFHHLERLSEAISFLSKKPGERTSQGTLPLRADLVLLDIKTYGLAALTSLQTTFPNLPMIVLVNANDDILGERAIEQGAHDYLMKEALTAEILLQSIQHAIEKEQLLDRLEQAEEGIVVFDALLNQILDALSDGVVVINKTGIIQFANTAASVLFNTHEDNLIGSPLGFSVPKEKNQEIQIKGKEEIMTLGSRSVQLKWKGKEATLIFLRDITEQKKSEKKLAHLTHHDALTGLPNRTFLLERLKKMIEHASQSSQLIAVFFLDIDRVAEVNDTLGFAMGDLLLQEISDRLTIIMRDIDLTARFGGHEFVAFLPVTELEAISHLAQTILDRLSEPYFLEGDEWGVTLAIGISLYPRDASDPEMLLDNAKKALHCVKKVGKNKYEYYAKASQTSAKEQMAVENSLRSALYQKNLFLAYQPIVSLVTGQIVGMEVLLRLKHEQMGVISPSRFIPIAEETGMIVKIGTWTLLNACAQNKTWQEMGLPETTMAVNLSAVQIREPNFISVVKNVLKHTRLEPTSLELELTESLMQDTERTLYVLDALHQMGVLSSIDDFGTGYSSLSHLRKFPFNTLKIDISFVQNMMNNENDKGLVATIITMAHHFQLKTIAEGVETLEQLQILQSLGCDEGQGFYFSKPLSADAATLLLAKRQSFF